MSQIAKLIGGQPGIANKALGAAVPALLSALLGTVTKDKSSADKFAAVLNQQKAGGADGLWSTFGSDPAKASSAGVDMLSSLLGGGTTSTLASGLESFAGLSDTASRSVLGTAAAAIMGGLGKTAKDRNLDAAGIIGALQSEKDEIARAMPGDFARQLEGTGVLDALSDRMDLVRGPAEAAATLETREPVRKPAPRVTTPPEPTGRPWWHWLLGLLMLAALLWFFFGRSEPEVVVEEEAVAEEVVTEEVVTEEAAVAPADDPLVVDGVNIAESLQSGLTQLQAGLAGVTDAASAEAILPDLTGFSEQLAGLEATVAGLPDAARSQLSGIVGGALPGLQETVDGLLANESVSGVLQQVLNTIMERLSALAA
jgi:hypothetical protein